MENIRIEKAKPIKVTLVKRVSNSVTSLYYFNVTILMRASDKKHYAVDDVVKVFDDDLFEYADKETLTKREIKTYARELIFASVESYVGDNLIRAINTCEKNVADYKSIL